MNDLDADDRARADGRWSRAAQVLVEQRRMRVPVAPLPPELAPRTEAEGYAVQRAAQPLLAAAGLGPVVGHKIGCTTDVMQAFLGIPNPAGGHIHAAGTPRGHGRVPRGRFVRVGVECEIAVELRRDLDAAGRPRPPDTSRMLFWKSCTSLLSAEWLSSFRSSA